MVSYKMLSLSEKLHKKIIRQAVPYVTDEEVYRVIHYWPSINPFYYPEFLDKTWLTCLKKDDANVPIECIQIEIGKEYEGCAIQPINCVDPIRVAVIYHLGVFNNYSKDFIDLKASESIDKHRHLVMRMGDRVSRF